MNYYEFQKASVKCKKCGWEGSGRETNPLEVFREVAEYCCPKCQEKIAVILHSSLHESRAHWSELSPLEQAHVELIERNLEEFEARRLTSASELPSIDLPAFVLLWDRDGDEPGRADTVIRLGDRVIWQEPQVYEGFWRYEEIVELLKSRYGSALQDLEPTVRSGDCLYGDRLGSLWGVQELRNGLRQAAAQPLEPLTCWT